MKTPREILLNRHRAAESKLDAVRERLLATTLSPIGGEGRGEGVQAQKRGERVRVRGLLLKLWRELILPCRRTWAGLAAIWLVLLALNLARDAGTETGSTNSAQPDSGVMAAVREQRQLLSQLLDPSPPSPADRPRIPGPRGAAPQVIQFA